MCNGMREHLEGNLKIDGRLIPYRFVTAADYLFAKGEIKTPEEMDTFMEEHYEQYQMLNQIIAIKQSCVLLKHTAYSCESLIDSLRELKNKLLKEYKERYQNYMFDEEFYEKNGSCDKTRKEEKYEL